MPAGRKLESYILVVAAYYQQVAAYYQQVAATWDVVVVVAAADVGSSHAAVAAAVDDARTAHAGLEVAAAVDTVIDVAAGVAVDHGGGSAKEVADGAAAVDVPARKMDCAAHILDPAVAVGRGGGRVVLHALPLDAVLGPVPLPPRPLHQAGTFRAHGPSSGPSRVHKN